MVSFTRRPSTFVTVNKRNETCVGDLPGNLPLWRPSLHPRCLLDRSNRRRRRRRLLVSDNDAEVFVSFPRFRLLGVLASIRQLHRRNQ